MPANRRGPIVCRCAFTIKLNVAAGLMAVAPGSLVAHSTCVMPVCLSACQRSSCLVHTVALWYGTPCRRLLTALCSEADARGLISFTYQQTVPCRAHSVAIAVGNFHRCVPLQHCRFSASDSLRCHRSTSRRLLSCTVCHWWHTSPSRVPPPTPTSPSLACATALRCGVRRSPFNGACAPLAVVIGTHSPLAVVADKVCSVLDACAFLLVDQTAARLFATAACPTLRCRTSFTSASAAPSRSWRTRLVIARPPRVVRRGS